MKVFDLHCDTVGCIYAKYADSIRENGLNIDVGKLKKGGSYVQCFGMFLYKGDGEYDFEKQREITELWKKVITAEPEFNWIRSSSDLKEDRLNAMMTLEEGGNLLGRPENLRWAWEQGVRMAALLWNYENAYGYPNSEDRAVMEPGLKPAGFEAVEQMNELGMIADVSHMSYGCFWDTVRHSQKPVIASHSCCESLHHHSRNLTDEMIRALADSGGVCGINFCKKFLSDETGDVTLEELAAQAGHLRNIGGADVIALGSDFDGIENGFEFGDASGMQRIKDKLIENGFTYSETEKIM